MLVTSWQATHTVAQDCRPDEETTVYIRDVPDFGTLAAILGVGRGAEMPRQIVTAFVAVGASRTALETGAGVMSTGRRVLGLLAGRGVGHPLTPARVAGSTRRRVRCCMAIVAVC